MGRGPDEGSSGYKTRAAAVYYYDHELDVPDLWKYVDDTTIL